MITKVSEITVEEIANYLRISEIDQDIEKELKQYLNVAICYIESYTGIPKNTTEENVKILDDYPDFYIVVLALCQTMYDNRSIYIEKNNKNTFIQNILDMYRMNFI